MSESAYSLRRYALQFSPKVYGVKAFEDGDGFANAAGKRPSFFLRENRGLLTFR